MKRILSAIILFLATITLMAQNSFVVVDKNGNSKFVQDLIFQQQNGAFSWGSSFDGYQQDQDIKDLLFIARANSTLTTGTAEEVTQTLQDLSGTDQANAEAVASAIKNNPNVAEAFSADGNNVAIRANADEGLRYYPLYSQESIFSESELEESLARLHVKATPSIASNGVKIAIFNFFKGNDLYKAQNRLVTRLKVWLKEHHYDVKEYAPGGNDGEFTQGMLETVCNASFSFGAIFVFTHGALNRDGNPIICTHEYADKSEDGIIDPVTDPITKKAYKALSVKQTFNEVRKGCIVYLGACDSAPKEGFKDSFSKYNSEVIGWSGRTRWAQVHAALLFYYQLYGGYSRAKTWNSLFMIDKSAKLSCSQEFQNGATVFNHDMNFVYNYSDKITATAEEEPETNGYRIKPIYKVTIRSNEPSYCKMRARLNNIITQEKYELTRNGIDRNIQIASTSTNGKKEISWDIPSLKQGVYSLEIIDNKTGEYIKLEKPVYKIIAEHYLEVGGDVVSAEDNTEPVIFDTDLKSVVEISVAAGSTQTYSIDGYEGHTFRCATLDTDVADVSISGKTLTVKGVSEGSTYIGVMDEQNKRMAIAEVTVTAGGDTPGPGPGGDVTAYTACPDANHPHWIDLGIGTQWRCCNEGASTPEEYGDYYDYYTFDQAQAYNPPSQDQIKALLNNCSSVWTTQNGVNGRLFTSKVNGNSIFLPGAGYVRYGELGDELGDVGSRGFYWSSTPHDESYACGLLFSSESAYWVKNGRVNGFSVRPVLKTSSVTLSVSTSSLSMTEGETSTVDITSGSGEYVVTNLNSDIAKATLDGTTITINAIAAGEAKIVVTDIQTGQKIIIEVTVTAKSSGYTPAGVEAVDLGLPSGTLWANMNVGAEKTEDYGLYFAWGETTGYTGDTSDGRSFVWESYKWCNGSETTLTKYCNNTEHGTVDNKTVLDAEDDAAHVNWGGSWRMPTLADFQELFNNTTNEGTTLNGVNGYLFTSKVNGNSIFLPAAGGRWGSDLSRAGSYGCYWSSSLVEIDPSYACGLYFISGGTYCDISGNFRYGGHTVRPVTNK